MLIAKDQPCNACIVKHGFSNQTGFVRHSSRSDRAPCKRTVKTYKRTRTTRRCVVEILWRIIRSRILISIVSIWIIMIFFPPRILSLCRLESVIYAIAISSSIFFYPFPPKCQVCFLFICLNTPLTVFLQRIKMTVVINTISANCSAMCNRVKLK